MQHKGGVDVLVAAGAAGHYVTGGRDGTLRCARQSRRGRQWQGECSMSPLTWSPTSM